MDNEQNKSCLTGQCLVLQEQQSQYTQILHNDFYVNQNLIDLKEIFQNNIKNYKTYKYRIYDHIKGQYVQLQYLTNNRFKIPLSFINPDHNLILIKYKRLTYDEAHHIRENKSQKSDKQAFSDTFSYKKQRSKERVIYEVIEIVKKWRQLHQNLNKNKKVSLQETAKIMGLSKKSLDDYYYQLRLGQKYGFDFKQNFHQRIGVLRTYLKSRNSHLKEKKIQNKYSKGLNVLDQFEQIQYSISSEQNSKKLQILDQNIQFFQEKQDERSRLMIQENEESRRIKLQNQFYENFGFESYHQDPFINLDRNIHEKKDEIFFEQQQFF